MRFYHRFLLWLLIALAAPLSLAAAAGKPPTAAPSIPPDTLGRETPRSMVAGLIGALAELDYDRAAQFLEIPASTSNRAIGPTLRAGSPRSAPKCRIAHYVRLRRPRTCGIHLILASGPRWLPGSTRKRSSAAGLLHVEVGCPGHPVVSPSYASWYASIPLGIGSWHGLRAPTVTS